MFPQDIVLRKVTVTNKILDIINKHSLEIDTSEYSIDTFNERWKVYSLRNQKGEGIMFCVSKNTYYKHIGFLVNNTDVSEELKDLISKYLKTKHNFATYLPKSFANKVQGRRCYSFLNEYPHYVLYVSDIDYKKQPKSNLVKFCYDKVEKLDLNDIETFKSKLSPELLQQYQEVETDDKNIEIYYVKAIKYIKGFCLVRYHPDSKHKGYIDYICVDKKYARQGIATSMLTYIKHQYKILNSTVEETNTASIMLHLNCGFKIDYRCVGYYFEDDINNNYGDGYQLSYKNVSNNNFVYKNEKGKLTLGNNNGKVE